MQSRTASAPWRSTDSSGPSAAPDRFEIFFPPLVTQPLEKKLANGSRKPTRPRSLSTLTQKRA